MEIFSVKHARDLTKQAQKSMLVAFVQKIKTEIEENASAGACGMRVDFPVHMCKENRNAILDQLRNEGFTIYVFSNEACFTIDW